MDCDRSFGGRRCGLCLLWKEPLDLIIKSYSPHHIDAVILPWNDISEWRVTGFYGWAEDMEKFNSWQLLSSLYADYNSHWLCLGDWNEIISSAEKEGGNPRPLAKMNAFRTALDDSGLVDLGFKGHHFTWTNDQRGISNIQERLDRCCANSRWIDFFSSHFMEHCVRIQSDHCPVVLSWNTSSWRP